MKLRACDIVFEEEQMIVKITSSKTNQYKDGATFPVAKSCCLTCPVAMLERYFVMAQVSRSDERYVSEVHCAHEEGRKSTIIW